MDSLKWGEIIFKKKKIQALSKKHITQGTTNLTIRIIVIISSKRIRSSFNFTAPLFI